jgi:hypothetical protein
VIKRFRKSLLGVSYKEATSFSEGNSRTWQHLEKAVLAAIEGYHATLESNKLEELVPRLNQVELSMRSYAYEGAAMGLTGLDCILPWKKQLRAYMRGPAASHIYMVHIGAGEALARLRRKPEPFIARLEDRVLCWLVMDGYGFHEGFFAPRRTVDEQRMPAHLSAYAARIFDQGVGRSLWFTCGAQVERIARRIAAFPASRQADLWVGMGVACTYVGGVERADIERLQQAAGSYASRLAMGASFVAKGRTLAGNLTPDSALACEVLCGLTSVQAADLVDQAFQQLPMDGPQPAFEIMQQRLLSHFKYRNGQPVHQQKEMH